jgi:hypothetical protein
MLSVDIDIWRSNSDSRPGKLYRCMAELTVTIVP